MIVRALLILLVALGLALPERGQGQISTTASWSCEFRSPTDCGFSIQAASSSRVTIVSPGRDGPTAVDLTTLVGDINIAGSGINERTDLTLSPQPNYCNQGQDEWWAHSVKFPPGYIMLPGISWNWSVVFDFHNTASGGGQPNFEVASTPLGVELHIAGGPNIVNGPGPGYFSIVLGPVNPNTWYDFIYHVKWSSGTDGFFIAWLNGNKVMDFSGPTLYTGQSCYLKLANYHVPLGIPLSVIHSRIVFGHSRADVDFPHIPNAPTIIQVH